MNLLQLLHDKNEFVLTTNQDAPFSKVFPENKVSTIPINPKDAVVPKEIREKGHAINEDIASVLQDALKKKGKRYYLKG